MPDFMNPSEDLIAGLTAGRNEKQDEVDALSEEIDRLTSALTALREAVKAWRRAELVSRNADPPNLTLSDIAHDARRHMLRLANATTTGDSDEN